MAADFFIFMSHCGVDRRDEDLALIHMFSLRNCFTYTKVENLSTHMTYEKSESVVAQSYPTPCDPMDCSNPKDCSDPMNYSPPGSSVHGILQARILEEIAISFSRGSSQPRDRTWVSSNSVQSILLLSRVQLFVTPRTAACQGSQSITNSQSLLKFMSIESVMLSNHHILCPPLLLLPSIFPSIRVSSNELTLHQVAKRLELQLQHQSFQ